MTKFPPDSLIANLGVQRFMVAAEQSAPGYSIGRWPPMGTAVCTDTLQVPGCATCAEQCALLAHGSLSQGCSSELMLS